MIVLVSDTSVIVDLERGQMLEPCFKLPFQFAVPDLLYKRELAEYGGPTLCKLGLRVEGLDKHELTAAMQTRHAHPKLSLPDAYAYTLAHSRKWTLLTGDGELRAVAERQKVESHGVLWVFDRLHETKVVERRLLVTGLETISNHPRCRLPRAEVVVRLELYGRD